MENNQPTNTPKYVALLMKKHCMSAEPLVAAQFDSYCYFSSMQAALCQGIICFMQTKSTSMRECMSPLNQLVPQHCCLEKQGHQHTG